jgi:mannose-6-phosphate isomerase-like protein (cupin superfamily)
MSNKVDKPWGYYEDYYRSDELVFKRLVIKPGERTSQQKHRLRSEVWYVKEGSGSAYKVSANHEAKITEISAGDTYKVGVNEEHQLVNNSDQDLVVLEIQMGQCSEDDIVRILDPYNR